MARPFPERPEQQLGREHQRVRLDPKHERVVSLLVCRIARPTVPVLGRAVAHHRRGHLLHQRDLTAELVRQPHVIGIEKSDVRPARGAEADVRDALIPRF